MGAVCYSLFDIYSLLYYRKLIIAFCSVNTSILTSLLYTHPFSKYTSESYSGCYQLQADLSRPLFNLSTFNTDSNLQSLKSRLKSHIKMRKV